MSLKINTLKHNRFQNVKIDFSETVESDQKQEADKHKLTPEEARLLERLMASQDHASNQAVNLNEKLDEKISTSNYVKEVEKQLDESRSEEWRKQQEKINDILNQPDVQPIDNPGNKDQDISHYKGPTHITYEFLEPPLNRNKTYLPVPVYKCEGEGTVIVDITVNQTGEVTGKKPIPMKIILIRSV